MPQTHLGSSPYWAVMKVLTPRSTRGFTLVEIAIAITIVALLAAIALPAYSRIKQRSVNTLLFNEFRIAASALNHYALENGVWPSDGAGGWPEDLKGYLPPPDRWDRPTPIGGHWAWTRDSDDVTASLRITGFTAPAKQLLDFDRMMDNGSIASGDLFVVGSSLVYVLER